MDKNATAINMSTSKLFTRYYSRRNGDFAEVQIIHNKFFILLSSCIKCRIAIIILRKYILRFEHIYYTGSLIFGWE